MTAPRGQKDKQQLLLMQLPVAAGQYASDRQNLRKADVFANTLFELSKCIRDDESVTLPKGRVMTAEQLRAEAAITMSNLDDADMHHALRFLPSRGGLLRSLSGRMISRHNMCLYVLNNPHRQRTHHDFLELALTMPFTDFTVPINDIPHTRAKILQMYISDASYLKEFKPEFALALLLLYFHQSTWAPQIPENACCMRTLVRVVLHCMHVTSRPMPAKFALFVGDAMNSPDEERAFRAHAAATERELAEQLLIERVGPSKHTISFSAAGRPCWADVTITRSNVTISLDDQQESAHASQTDGGRCCTL